MYTEENMLEKYHISSKTRRLQFRMTPECWTQEKLDANKGAVLITMSVIVVLSVAIVAYCNAATLLFVASATLITLCLKVARLFGTLALHGNWYQFEIEMRVRCAISVGHKIQKKRDGWGTCVMHLAHLASHDTLLSCPPFHSPLFCGTSSTHSA